MPELWIRGIALLGLGFLFVAIILVGIASVDPTLNWSQVGLEVTYSILWIVGFAIIMFAIWRLAK